MFRAIFLNLLFISIGVTAQQTCSDLECLFNHRIAYTYEGTGDEIVQLSSAPLKVYIEPANQPAPFNNIETIRVMVESQTGLIFQITGELSDFPNHDACNSARKPIFNYLENSGAVKEYEEYDQSNLKSLPEEVRSQIDTNYFKNFRSIDGRRKGNAECSMGTTGSWKLFFGIWDEEIMQRVMARIPLMPNNTLKGTANDAVP